MRVLVCVLTLLIAAPSADACSFPYVSMFTVFDQSETVAHGRVRNHNGRLVIDVIKTFKGSPGNTIDLKLKTIGAHSTCTPSRLFKRHATGIIYLTAEGHFAAAFDSFPSASKPLMEAMTAYSAASDAASRASVLVEAAFSKNNRIATDAGLTLADDPELLNAVTTKDRDRLRLLLPSEGSVENGMSYIPLALVRLGAPIEKDLPKWMPEADLLKHRVFENVTDASKLADEIAATPKGGSARASAAFERCERVWGKHLFSVRHLAALGGVDGGLDWKSLAQICRSGKPSD